MSDGFKLLLFAALPTYDQVGLFAPFLLLLVRLLQGLSVGGEYGAVATYMSELGLKGQRGFTHLSNMSLSGGQLLASLLGVILLTFLSEQQLHDGGWRIPFVIGGIAAILSLLARSRLEETLSHQDSERKESGSLRELFKSTGKPFIGGWIHFCWFINVLCRDCLFKNLFNQLRDGWKNRWLYHDLRPICLYVCSTCIWCNFGPYWTTLFNVGI